MAASRADAASLPPVQFAKYVDGQLQRFNAHTADLEYLAISHVWGNLTDVELLEIPGIPGKVKATPKKAKYIEHELPKLVGSTPFWMDLLTVDQNDRAAVIAVTQSIPSIFRNATRTIAIRENDGIYECCTNAIQNFESYKEFGQKMKDHLKTHTGYVIEESYVQRLWTLQECLLSPTIQFVAVPHVKPVRRRNDGGGEHYKTGTEMERVLDSLFVLAYSFAGNRESDAVDFINAYVNCQTVTKAKYVPDHELPDDIYSGNFRRMNLASSRTASKARDYIFSTMPQFDWYTRPTNAKSMSFNDLFVDLCQQTSGTSHAFAYRIPRSLTDHKSCSDVETAWQPSPAQPEPACLGDFLKLLGQRFDGKHSLDANDLHVTSPVMIAENVDDHSESVLNMIRTSMAFSQQAWQEAHKGGELSRYSNFPELTWHLDDRDALLMGWEPGNNQHGIRTVEDGDAFHVVFGAGWEYDEIDLPEFSDESRQAWLGNPERETLLQHATKVLDHMWCAGQGSRYGSQMNDWRAFDEQMRPQWSKPLLRTMLLLAGMIGCGIGLSAGVWANKHFVPVYVRLNQIRTIGLLARHARVAPSERASVQYRLCVGRHNPGDVFRVGKDLLLVDPRTAYPIGLIPDFLADFGQPSRTDEVYVERMLALYQNSEDMGEGRVGCFHYPLRNIKEHLPRFAKQPETKEDDEMDDMRALVQELGSILMNAKMRQTQPAVKNETRVSSKSGPTATATAPKPKPQTAPPPRARPVQRTTQSQLNVPTSNSSSRSPSKSPALSAKDVPTKQWNDLPDDFLPTPSPRTRSRVSTPRSRTSTPRSGTASPMHPLPDSATSVFFNGSEQPGEFAKESLPASGYEPPSFEAPSFEPPKDEEEKKESKCMVM